MGAVVELVEARLGLIQYFLLGQFLYLHFIFNYFRGIREDST